MRQIIKALAESLRGNARLATVAIVLSLYNLVAFHFPLFRLVMECVDGGGNAVLLISSFVLLIVAANFMVFYLFIYLLRIVGKVLVAVMFLGNAIALYFVNTYEVLITRDMMANTPLGGIGLLFAYAGALLVAHWRTPLPLPLYAPL